MFGLMGQWSTTSVDIGITKFSVILFVVRVNTHWYTRIPSNFSPKTSGSTPWYGWTWPRKILGLTRKSSIHDISWTGHWGKLLKATFTSPIRQKYLLRTKNSWLNSLIPNQTWDHTLSARASRSWKKFYSRIMSVTPSCWRTTWTQHCVRLFSTRKGTTTKW